MPTQTYVITATHPDGRPYRDALGQHATVDGGVAAYGEKDRDQRLADIRAAGLTPHIRKA